MTDTVSADADPVSDYASTVSDYARAVSDYASASADAGRAEDIAAHRLITRQVIDTDRAEDHLSRG